MKIDFFIDLLKDLKKEFGNQELYITDTRNKSDLLCFAHGGHHGIRIMIKPETVIDGLIVEIRVIDENQKTH